MVQRVFRPAFGLAVALLVLGGLPRQSRAGDLTTLAYFMGPNGSDPHYSGVTLDANGDLYGTTAGGGANNLGTVWEIAQGSNSLTTLASFNGSTGFGPYGGVTADANGNLYGTTGGGGSNNTGTVFEIAMGQALSPRLHRSVVLGLILMPGSPWTPKETFTV